MVGDISPHLPLLDFSLRLLSLRFYLSSNEFASDPKNATSPLFTLMDLVVDSNEVANCNGDGEDDEYGSEKVIRLPDESTPSEIRNNPRFYPYFKDCVGALDGTYVRASVPLNIQGRFHSRKGGTTQNVLAAITFDLKFSYVLAGWEGSAHDSRILSDALSRPRGLKIPEGKYYLADAGYGIRNRYITPYRGVRYHLKEFSAQGPENAKELFNLRHSSLRITIERVFGILKKRFRVLDAEPFWNFQTQWYCLLFVIGDVGLIVLFIVLLLLLMFLLL
ncbi:hypothetical protein J1N35_037223 [Gossypium stocksii]|uniref:DDE Tnp4 domain-containing protein n=1 Tax=Gossypium stocksii TaxID=47602 RepID=A0A9D3ULL0_9ROSI|nr:hypothetical protein J1N35_037223 [Gossypium stocksii]